MRTLQAATRQLRLPHLSTCLAAAIILGILGMHALAHKEPLPLAEASHHGVSSVNEGPTTVHDMSVMPVAATAPPAPDGTGVLGAAAIATGVAWGPAAEGMPAHSTGDMVMLCAAMLLAAAASALLALRLQRVAHTILTRLKPLAHVLVILPTGGAGTGPPPLLQFSVIRC